MISLLYLQRDKKTFQHLNNGYYSKYLFKRFTVFWVRLAMDENDDDDDDDDSDDNDDEDDNEVYGSHLFCESIRVFFPHQRMLIRRKENCSKHTQDVNGTV